MNKLIKNTNVYKKVCLDFEREKLSHAYLLLSEDKTALMQTCRMIACKILCKDDNSPCLNCSVCNRIQKGIFPDVVEIGDKRTIIVDDIEKITEDAYVGAFESNYKIYILYNVENMNEDASNKILKTLEEPPKNVIFFLCANNEFALLQTIISRTEKIYLQRFKTEELMSALKESGVDEQICLTCANMSDGLLTRAVNLSMDKDYLKLYELVLKTIQNLKTAQDIAKYCTEFVAVKQSFEKAIDIFCNIFRDFLMFKLGLIDVVSNNQILNLFQNCENDYSKTAILKILQKIIDLKQKIFYNVGVVELIDEFLFYFVEVKIKCKE